MMQWKNINEFLNIQCSKYNTKIYLNDIENNTLYTYKEFNEKLNQIANFLYNTGVRKGDVVGVVLPNSPEICFLFFSCMKLGALFNPMYELLKEEEMQRNFSLSNPNIIIAGEDSYQKLLGILSVVKSVKQILSIDEFNKKIASQNKIFTEKELVTIQDYATFVYTSGTTAQQKGIRISQKNILADQHAVNKRWQLTEKDNILCTLPIAWAGGQYNFVFPAMLSGATMFLPKKFSKHNFWQWIKKHKITYTFLVPTMFAMLLNPPDKISRDSIQSVRFIYSGGAPLPKEVQLAFEERFGVAIYEVYGLSEVTAMSNVMEPNLKKRKIGSVGRQLECCDVKILDEHYKELLAGEIGEVCIKGYNVFDGYVNEPEANKIAFAGGWFHSGDLGYIDADGYLYITGRKKEIIIRGGINISPVEIDSVFYKHPAVKEAAAFGAPDKIYGEEVYAAIVLKENTKITESELQQYCKLHLADFKCPKNIFFVEELPKGPTGKLQRRKLIEFIQNS